MQQFAFSFMPNADLKPVELRSMLSRIGKCHACKKVSRKDYTATRVERVGTGMFRHDATVYGLEHQSYYADGSPASVVFIRAGRDYCCPRCGEQAWSSKVIEGRFNAAVKCNARCQGATGHDCECQCGGANHGRGFICE